MIATTSCTIPTEVGKVDNSWQVDGGLFKDRGGGGDEVTAES